MIISSQLYHSICLTDLEKRDPIIKKRLAFLIETNHKMEVMLSEKIVEFTLNIGKLCAYVHEQLPKVDVSFFLLDPTTNHALFSSVFNHLKILFSIRDKSQIEEIQTTILAFISKTSGEPLVKDLMKQSLLFMGDQTILKLHPFEFLISTRPYDSFYLTAIDSPQYNIETKEFRISKEAGEDPLEALSSIFKGDIPFSEKVQRRMDDLPTATIWLLFWIMSYRCQQNLHLQNYLLNRWKNHWEKRRSNKIDIAIRDKVKSKIKNEIKNEISTEIIEKLKKRVTEENTTEISHEIKNKIDNEIKDEIATEFSSNIDHLQDTLQRSLGHDIIHETFLPYLINLLRLCDSHESHLKNIQAPILSKIETIIKIKPTNRLVDRYSKMAIEKKSVGSIDEELAMLLCLVPFPQKGKIPVIKVDKWSVHFTLDKLPAISEIFASKFAQSIFNSLDNKTVKKQPTCSDDIITELFHSICTPQDFTTLPKKAELIAHWNNMLIDWGTVVSLQQRPFFLKVAQRLINLIHKMEPSSDLSSLHALYFDILAQELNPESLKSSFLTSLSDEKQAYYILERLLIKIESRLKFSEILQLLIPLFSLTLKTLNDSEKIVTRKRLTTCLLHESKKQLKDLTPLLPLFELIDPKMLIQSRENGNTELVDTIILFYLAHLIKTAINGSKPEDIPWNKISLLLKQSPCFSLDLTSCKLLLKKSTKYPSVALNVTTTILSRREKLQAPSYYLGLACEWMRLFPEASPQDITKVANATKEVLLTVKTVPSIHDLRKLDSFIVEESFTTPILSALLQGLQKEKEIPTEIWTHIHKSLGKYNNHKASIVTILEKHALQRDPEPSTFWMIEETKVLLRWNSLDWKSYLERLNSNSLKFLQGQDQALTIKGIDLIIWALEKHCKDADLCSSLLIHAFSGDGTPLLNTGQMKRWMTCHVSLLKSTDALENLENLLKFYRLLSNIYLPSTPLHLCELIAKCPDQPKMHHELIPKTLELILAYQPPKKKEPLLELEDLDIALVPVFNCLKSSIHRCPIVSLKDDKRFQLWVRLFKKAQEFGLCKLEFQSMALSGVFDMLAQAQDKNDKNLIPCIMEVTSLIFSSPTIDDNEQINYSSFILKPYSSLVNANNISPLAKNIETSHLNLELISLFHRDHIKMLVKVTNGGKFNAPVEKSTYSSQYISILKNYLVIIKEKVQIANSCLTSYQKTKEYKNKPEICSLPNFNRWIEELQILFNYDKNLNPYIEEAIVEFKKHKPNVDILFKKK